MNLTIIGRGKLGRGLARTLRSSGHRVSLCSHRTRRLVEDDALILAVPDAFIEETAVYVRPRVAHATPVLHCAGSFGPEALGFLKPTHQVGVMHPLASFPTAASKVCLKGTTWFIDGDPRATRVASRIASSVGALPLVADVHGPRYHAAATFVAAGTAALLRRAVELWDPLPLSKATAERALVALTRTVLDNASSGLARALSGPVARADQEAIRSHRRMLSEDEREHYDAVANLIIATASELTPEQAEQLRSQLRKKPTSRPSRKR